LKILAPFVVIALGLPSWIHLPTWAERWLWNPRERTAVALDAVERGQPEEAVRPLQTASRLRPDDPYTKFNEGTGSLAAGDAQDAIAPLESAAAGAPPELRPSARFNLGTAKLAAGDAAGAVAALKEAVRLAPAAEDAKWNLELALRELEQENQAKKPQEAPQGEKPGEQESGSGEGAEQPADPQQPQQPQQPPPPNQSQPDPGSEQPLQGPPDPAQRDQESQRLPNFRDQQDMTAEQAATILQAVENLERDRRRREALQVRKAKSGEEKDW
jgi:tetratricopeptide (TPR) repeat protein